MNLIRRGIPVVVGAADDTPAGRITRGVTRLLTQMGYATLHEFKLTSRRRVDVAGLDAGGRFAVVEVKSCLADFRADRKWTEYLDYADVFYFAVDAEFPREVLPEECGLIVADAFEAAIVREAPERPLNATRRRHQTQRFARTAAGRLTSLLDPSV